MASPQANPHVIKPPRINSREIYTEISPNALIAKMRAIIAPPDIPKNNRLCIDQLPAEKLLIAWKLHTKGVSASQIAITCQSEWGYCTTYSKDQLAGSFLKLFNRMALDQDLAFNETLNIRKKADEERRELQRLKEQRLMLQQQLEENVSPLAEMVNLICIQRTRLDAAVARESTSKKQDPKIDGMLKKHAFLVKELVNISEIMGLYKGARDPVAAGAQSIHLHLEQSIADRPAVGNAVNSFLAKMEEMATASIDRDGKLLTNDPGDTIDIDTEQSTGTGD